MTQIRIHNASTIDYKNVSVAGQRYGDIAAGATSRSISVPLRFRYGIVRLTAAGRRINGQTLSSGGRKSTHRIDIADLDAGHLTIEVVRERTE